MNEYFEGDGLEFLCERCGAVLEISFRLCFEIVLGVRSASSRGGGLYFIF